MSEGDSVEKGQGLVIVEAMKMENEVRSPIAGEVKEIKVKPGDAVEGGRGPCNRRVTALKQTFSVKNSCQQISFMLYTTAQ